MDKPSSCLFCVLLVLLCALLSACEEQAPLIEQRNLPTQADPTSVAVRYRSPVPTLTAAIPTPTPTENLDPDYYFGGMMITLDDVGKTISLKEGQDFYLSLGETYRWNVLIDPPGLASRNLKITPEPGDQGIYIARETGLGVLRATGTAGCRMENPPCALPDLLFELYIVVE